MAVGAYTHSVTDVARTGFADLTAQGSHFSGRDSLSISPGLGYVLSKGGSRGEAKTAMQRSVFDGTHTVP